MAMRSRRLGVLARTACATAALLALSGFVSDGPDAASSDSFRYLGEISLVGFNFVPSGWAPADGRSLRIDEHEALFGLLGTKYGGDGTTTFNLPTLAAPQQGIAYVISLYGQYPAP